MQIIDLSHFISNDMPVYPDTHSPVIQVANTIEKNGYAEKVISMSTHTGTHIDAPAHMIKGSKTLDMFGIDHFIGEGKVIDLSGKEKKLIETEDLADEMDGIEKIDFLLFYTGWSRFWGDEKYFRDYPVLSENLVKSLTGYKLKGIGFDIISIDPVGVSEFRNHMTVFGKNMIIIENLKNLETLIGKVFTFFCLPLKIEDSDGSPVRACAIIH
jgi:kynurenine formamidase